MLYAIKLSPSALADIIVARDYYNSKVDGLGRRMANEIDLVLNRIVAAPKANAVRYRQIRAAKVTSFPYLVFYKIEEKHKSIQVMRIFNTHQQPFWWQ
jgi:toxin ParE1/3/4